MADLETRSEQTKQPSITDNRPPDPEVVPKAERRRFTAAYKLRILEEADACTQPGQIGALLRREGLYSSHLDRWRKLRRKGQLAALTPESRGRKPPTPAQEELARLQQENKRLRARLEQAELVIDVQKKLSRLLGLTAHESDENR